MFCKKKYYLHFFIDSLLCLILFGCHSSHEYAQTIDPPYLALEQSLDVAANDPGMDVATILPPDWWTIFDDEQLSHFIQLALIRNPTLQAAQAKIAAARSNAEKAYAMLFPTITWSADVLREKLSKTGLAGATPSPTPPPPPLVIPIPAPPGVLPFYFTQYETSLNLSYDFDFWNKKRNTFRAAVGEIKARMADEIFSRLQLSVAVAQTYFQLQVGYARQEIASRIVENDALNVELIKFRVERNLDNEEALLTAESNLIAAKQNLLQIQGNIAINEYQLRAYLANNFEDEISDVKITPEELPTVPIPKELPLRLVAYRPDIIAQLWLIESAGKRIEVAKAGFYPDFNLTGYVGFQTIHFKKWFEGRSIYAAIDPAFTLPIFDGGLLEANLEGSRVDYDLAILQYNQMVLDAARDVLTSVAVLHNVNLQLEEFEKRVEKQHELLELTNERVAKNLDSDLNRILREQQLLAANDQKMQVLGSTFQASLSLIKALGGGYDACAINQTH